MRGFLRHRLVQLVIGLSLVAACKPANTGGTAPPADTPTPAPPGDPYSNETYAAALRSASNKLRGKLPAVADLTAVLDGGRTAYQEVLDRYLDTAQNADLAPTLKRFFRKVFVMGEKTEDVRPPGAPDDGTGDITLDYDEPANLATYIFVNDKSWREVFTADYCVDGNLQTIPCSGGSPIQSGILTNQPFLRQFGKINALNYQRTSVIHQLANCQIYPDGDDEGWARCNNCGDDPATILPPDDPNDPLPRLHEKYQATMDSITCHACHRNLTTRRQVWSKFDIDGFYRANFTINNIEAASENFAACFVVPQGTTEICPPNGNLPDGRGCNTQDVDGGRMIRECDPARTVDDNINRNQFSDCCYNPAFTDRNSEDSVVCNDPTQAWCTGTYKGQSMQTPRDYAGLLMDESVNGTTFDVCQTRRFYAFALGLETGMLGLQAGDGIPPAATDAAILEKFRSSFAHNNYSVRALLRTLFLSDEFLSSQQ